MRHPGLTTACWLILVGQAAAHDGAEITVRGQRPAPSAGSSVVEPARLAQAPARSAADLLRQAPGVAVGRHGAEGKGVQVFLRGFDAVHGSDVEVCLDGIPLNEPGNVHGHGYVDLGLVVPQAVRALQVDKGAFALDQGDFATAGRLDFRLGPAPGAQVSLLGSTLNRHRLAARWAHGDAFVAGEAIVAQGFGQQRAARRAAALSRIPLTDGLALLLGAATARFELPAAVRREDVTAGRVGFYDSYTDDTGGGSDQALLAAVAHTHLGPARVDGRAWLRARRLQLTENYTGFLQDPAGGDRRAQRDGRAELGLRGTLRWAGPILGLRAHARLRHTTAQVVEDGLPEGAPAVPRRDLDQRITASGLGLAVDAALPAHVELEASARIDGWAVALDDRQAGAQADSLTWALAPRARAAWRPSPRLHAFAAWGRGLRPPEPAQALGAAAPRPVAADQAEVGVRSQFGPARLGVAAFRVDIDREAIFDHPTGLTVERGATRRDGVELDGQVTVGPVRLTADLLWARARFVADGAPVPNAPRLRLAGGARYGGATGLQLGTRAEYLGPRPLNYGARAGAALRLDARLGWRFERVALRLDLENVLGRQDADLEGQYASRWDRTRPGDPLPALHAFPLPPVNGWLTVTVDL